MALRIVMDNPNIPKKDYCYQKNLLQDAEIITLDKKLENGIARELITFKLHHGKRKIKGWRNSSLLPFNKLVIHNVEAHLDFLKEMFRIKGVLTFEFHNFLWLWRKLETKQPKLPPKESQRLFQLGREQSRPYGAKPVQDAVINQLLPIERIEDQYSISDPGLIPEELICPGCRQPLFHALLVPCGARSCRECIRTSDSDASGRLICSAKGCQDAHYPFDYQWDIHTVKALREYADPDSLITSPAAVQKTLADLIKAEDQLANSLSFYSLRYLRKNKATGTPSVADAHQSLRESLEVLSADDAPENLQERASQLLIYHNTLAKFVISHLPLLIAGEEKIDDDELKQIIHNILKHSYALATREFSVLGAFLESEAPNKLEQFLAYIILTIDSAILHIDHLLLLDDGLQGAEPATSPQLLTDLPQALYPELLSKLKRLYESELLLNTVRTEAEQEAYEFTFKVMLILFPCVLEMPQRPILFGQASNMEILTALLQHISLVSSFLSPFEYQYYWERLLPVLMQMGEEAFPAENARAFGEIINLLAGQIQDFNDSFAHQMVYYPFTGNRPDIECMTRLLDFFLSDFVPLFFQWVERVDISDKNTDAFHPWVQTPEVLTKTLSETRQTLLDNKARADRFRQEQQQSWDTRRSELLAQNMKKREKLKQLQQNAESDEHKEQYPMAWEGIDIFNNHLDVLENAIVSSYHLKQLLSYVHPIVPMVDYRHVDPVEFLNIIRQLLDHIGLLYEPMINVINCYSRAIHGFLSDKTNLTVLGSMEHVELMEASSNWLEKTMVDIQCRLNESHQTIADWLTSTVEIKTDMLPIKLMAQIIDQMQRTREEVDSIIKKISLFAAWLESWNRALDEIDFPIPSSSSRRDKRDFVTIFNNLSDNYSVHWVAPDGNCLYSALLMSTTPNHEHPSSEQIVEFRQRLLRLLKEIIETIQQEVDQDKQRLYWQQLSTLLSLSQPEILALVNSGTTLDPASPEMETVPANYGEMAFIAPLAIIELNTSVSFMDISNPLEPDSWVQHHENIFSSWLHNVPELLNALIEAEVIDVEQIAHGEELMLALLSQSPEIIQETVEQFSITTSSFIIIHTGSSHNASGHFFAASSATLDEQEEEFKQYLSTLDAAREQPQDSSASTAMATLMIMEQVMNSHH